MYTQRLVEQVEYKNMKYRYLKTLLFYDSRPIMVKMIFISISLRLHGIVVVGHQTRRFSTSGVLKTRVIGIAEDSLDPRQDPSGGHGLVREVA